MQALSHFDIEAQNSEPYLLIQECYRVLRNAKSNVVWEILRQSESFLQWTHYPKGDVMDKQSHSQYYYHAHPSKDGSSREEHGHFHLFLRKGALSESATPVKLPTHCVPEGSQFQELCHLVGIAMDNRGFPIRLFTTNRWVTGETWYRAEDIVRMLDRFVIDHCYPSWPTNIWLSAMVKLFKTEITDLLYQRDQAILAWQKQYPQANVYEDRKLEITSQLDIRLEST